MSRIFASKKTILSLCRKYKISPSKGLGQHFLTDKFALKKLILSAELKPKEIILEVGPGFGTLTQELAKRVGKVIAVEKDQRMIDVLEEAIKGFRNVEILKKDIRYLETKFLKSLGKFKVVANLPFYLTAPVIRKFLESKNKPELMVLIVQKEVAQRIAARPPKMNLLAVSVQFYAKPKIMDYIPKTSFWPQPKVDSAIIKITPSKLSIPEINRLFFTIVKAGFSQPRKQLVNTLSKGLKLDKAKAADWLLENKIKPTQRAETLSVEDWINLMKTFDVK